MNFLPDSKIPEGVFEIANEMRNTVVISKTWKARNQAKISGKSDPEIRVLYFDCKIEETAKKAISLITISCIGLLLSCLLVPIQ